MQLFRWFMAAMLSVGLAISYLVCRAYTTLELPESLALAAWAGLTILVLNDARNESLTLRGVAVVSLVALVLAATLPTTISATVALVWICVGYAFFEWLGDKSCNFFVDIAPIAAFAVGVMFSPVWGFGGLLAMIVFQSVIIMVFRPSSLREPVREQKLPDRLT